MLRCFRTAVVEYGFLSRVRCDYGGENVDMARLMITTRGTGGGSVITSSSTHNQCIEMFAEMSQHGKNHLFLHGNLDIRCLERTVIHLHALSNQYVVPIHMPVYKITIPLH